MEGKGIAATPEELGSIRIGKYNHEQRKKLFGIEQSHLYFAAGNLIIDCDYWRKNHITEKLITKTNELRDKLVCPDLDVMNVIFQDNYKRLHFRYCTTVHRYNAIAGNQEMIEGYKNPFIIHYSGAKKPWDTKDVLFFKEWDDIYKKTAYYSPLKNAIKPYIFFPYYLLATLFLRRKKAKLAKKQESAKRKKQKIYKKTSYVKLFKCLPVLSIKNSGGKKVWKIFGLPIFKRRILADRKTVKYYFMGINIIQTSEKSVEAWR